MSTRADARANRRLLLTTAATVFKRDGADASMKSIAREAQVGVGTLYRHFPTRDALVQALYEDEIQRLCSAAEALLETQEAEAALRTWMHRFIDFMDGKKELGDVLKAVLVDEADRMRTRRRLADALQVLLAAGVQDQRFRMDVPAYDVLMALGGTVLIADGEAQTALRGRLVDLLIDGLRRSDGT